MIPSKIPTFNKDYLYDFTKILYAYTITGRVVNMCFLLVGEF